METPKADYYTLKPKSKHRFREIYHSHNGADGYRSMKVYLERKGYSYSITSLFINI